MSGRFPVIISILVLQAGLIASGCGGEEASTPAQANANAAGAPPNALVQAALTAAQSGLSELSTSVGKEGEDPEKGCLVQAVCERRCSAECAREERDRTAFFDAKRARVGGAPFTVKFTRVYVEGACAQGDDPLKRKSTSGLKAVVDGEMTYNGPDLLYAAELGGELFLRFGADRYAEAPVADKTYTGGWYGRTKEASRFERAVSGADPWTSGQTRPFHWESRPLSEAFCEVLPDEAAVYVELATYGVRQGRATSSIGFASLNWDEVIGMAMRQQISVITKKDKETVLEPADAIYGVLDKILVTRLTGKTEWLKRSITAQSDKIPRAPSAAFPVEASAGQWKIAVTGISTVKELGGYAHKGEDQFLAVVDLTITNKGEEAASISKTELKLEVAPGKWVKPADKAMGQLDLSGEIPAGSSLSGKIVFPRQRFQRPFRLEVKTPDKTSLVLDVFSYDIGPERAPK